MADEQLDLLKAKQAGEEAIERVRKAAGREWVAHARSAVLNIACSRIEFTSDDVWEYGLPKPREARALGAVMAQLARECRIERTGAYRPTRQVSRHGAPIAVWRMYQ